MSDVSGEPHRMSVLSDSRIPVLHPVIIFSSGMPSIASCVTALPILAIGQLPYRSSTHVTGHCHVYENQSVGLGTIPGI